MDEPNIHPTGQTPETTETSSSDVPEDRLLTTRLPPISPPHYHYSSAPPASLDSPLSRLPPVPLAPPSAPYRAQDISAPPQPKPSWWRTLLTATVPPPPVSVATSATDEGVVRRRIAATCAGMALGFVILSLALGLRGADPSPVPIIGAALVIARAAVSLGFLAFGHALLRMSERFLTGRSNDANPRSTSTPNLH
jgi:hypothetical protein